MINKTLFKLFNWITNMLASPPRFPVSCLYYLVLHFQTAKEGFPLSKGRVYSMCFIFLVFLEEAEFYFFNHRLTLID